MFLKRLAEQRKTLSFRLTLWYGGIFIVSSFMVFLIFYMSAASVIYGRTDEELWEEMEEYSSLLSSSGFQKLVNEVVNEIESEDPNKIFYQVIRSDGTIIVSSDMSSWGNPGIGKKVLKHLNNGGDPIFETVFMHHKPYNIRIIHRKIGQDVIVRAGILLEKETRLMTVFKKVFGISMIVALIFAGILGWFMAKRALSGVEEVTRTAQQIIKGDLEKRVNVKTRGNEIEQLVSTFNHMLDRIHKLIKEMREMTDNIAHDLKSPLTRIRGIAEVTLTSGGSAGEYEHMSASIIEECDSLVEMINTMLDISEIETGAGKVEFKKIEMAGLVRDICELFEPLAENKKQALACDVSEQLLINGDLKILQRMVSNLLDNAIKYTPDSGTVTVSLYENGTKQAVLCVSDTGIGICKDDLPNIFERFYRGDRSRSKTGNGLGLSLVKAIVAVHGGDITVLSQPDKGSAFTVMLPLLCQFPETEKMPEYYCGNPGTPIPVS